MKTAPFNIHVDFVDVNDLRASQAEAALDAAHFPLPLSSRIAWGRNFGTSNHPFAIAMNTDKQWVATIGLELKPTRSFPGHHIVRVRTVGDAYATTAGNALLHKIAHYAATHGRVLRVIVELECRTNQAREFLHQTLITLGFHQVHPERIPAHTLIINLTQDEEKIFAAFGKSTRYEIRKATKSGLQLALLTDPIYGARMNNLLSATFARTGVSIAKLDWKPMIGLCRELPHRSHLIGVFHGSGRAPEELLAFAWGIHHGERAVYHTSASMRDPGVRFPLLYAALWDLIVWAKREGATWFDLGGITPSISESGDSLGRISKFKRGFSQEEIALGEEWVYEPSPFKSGIARLTSNTADQVRGFLQRFGGGLFNGR